MANLSNECKNSKNSYKFSVIEKPMLGDCLNNIIYDSAEYYTNNIPNNDTIDNKNRFLRILTKSMLDIAIDLNNKQEQLYIKNTEER